MTLSLGFMSCSDDDDVVYPKPNPVEVSNLAIDNDTVRVGVHESTTFNIISGAGDYRVISEDTAVATASVSGTAVTVNSQKKGITGLIISDAKGGYKRVLVQSMYFSMRLDKDAVSIGIKLGHTDGEVRVKILEGNGNYSAVSSDEDVVTVSRVIGDSVLVMDAVHNGTATVTVRDMMGLTQTVAVTVEETSEAYSEDEKQELMADEAPHFTWDGRRNSGGSYLFTHETASDGRSVAFYQYNSTWYRAKYTQVWFTGDFSVGVKTDGRIFYDDSWSGYDYTENVSVEIIKNDGSKAWGIFSVIKDNYLHYGNFVINL